MSSVSSSEAIVIVSIHAPRCRGAMHPEKMWQEYPSTPFQSTLPVAGERCMGSMIGRSTIVLFQSTLPVAGERCSTAASNCSVLV